MSPVSTCENSYVIALPEPFFSSWAKGTLNLADDCGVFPCTNFRDQHIVISRPIEHIIGIALELRTSWSILFLTLGVAASECPCRETSIVSP